MAKKLFFQENVDVLPERDETYAKPEDWTPTDSPCSEKLKRTHLRLASSFSQDIRFLAKPCSYHLSSQNCRSDLPSENGYLGLGKSKVIRMEGKGMAGCIP